MNNIILFFIIFIILVLLIVLILQNKLQNKFGGTYDSSAAYDADSELNPAFEDLLYDSHSAAHSGTRSVVNPYVFDPSSDYRHDKKFKYAHKYERFPDTNYRQKDYERYPNKDLVIDTLNLAGRLFSKSPIHEEIIESIKYATPILKQFFPGRLMFVFKSKTSRNATKEEIDEYKNLASELKVFIYIVEQYEENGPTWKLEKRFASNTHSIGARDDLYAMLLSKRYKCPLLTNDKLLDLNEFKSTVAPFKVLIFDYFTTKQPTKESIVPASLPQYEELKKRFFTRKLYNYFKERELAPPTVTDNIADNVAE